jgi:hypothetical protein
MSDENEKKISAQSEQFGHLITTLEKIANRTSIITTVEPRPLSESANEQVGVYRDIALSLRTIFEDVGTTTAK